jgi:hypothetical protein
MFKNIPWTEVQKAQSFITFQTSLLEKFLGAEYDGSCM